MKLTKNRIKKWIYKQLLQLFQANIDIEQWKYNKQYKVKVSSWGNVKTKSNERISPMKQKGYIFVTTPSNRIAPVHRLVLQTFKPVENLTSLTVEHKNRNTMDNHLKNLEWKTVEDNNALACQSDIDLVKVEQILLQNNSLKEKNEVLKKKLHTAKQKLQKLSIEII